MRPETTTTPVASLTSDQGNSGTASATLTVDGNRPGFSKSFSPAVIGAGQTSTLTFTIDNSQVGTQVFNLCFTDFLPAGLSIASPANVTTDCIGTLQADAGNTTIGFFGGFLAANASCTISVDVTAATAGRRDNLTSSLSSSKGSSGMATSSLDVRQGVLSKVFTDDPVRPGGSGTLHFTISNFDRANAMDGITFSDDLDATLSGLVATGLPANDVCGSGSQLSGSSLLTLDRRPSGSGHTLRIRCHLSGPGRRRSRSISQYHQQPEFRSRRQPRNRRPGHRYPGGAALSGADQDIHG